MVDWTAWIEPALTLLFGAIGVFTGVKVSIALLKKDIEHIKERVEALDRSDTRAAEERGRIYERMDHMNERIARLEGKAGI